MIKKIISLTLVILISFQIFIFQYDKNQVYAVNKLSEEYAKTILVPLLISSGLVFSNNESLNNTVDSLYNHLQDVNELSQIFVQGTSGIVKDVVTGTFKQIIDVSDSFWNTVKNFVNYKYDVGENVITEINPIYNNNALDVSDGTYYFDLPLGYSVFRYSKFVGKYSPTYQEIVGKSLTTFLKISHYDSANPDSVLINFNVGGKNHAYSGEVEFFYYCIAPSSKIPQFYNENSYGFGVEYIIDNLDYDWTNSNTGVRSISIPIDTAPDGNPALEKHEDGRVFPIPYIPSVPWGIDVNPEDVYSQDLTGSGVVTGTIVSTGELVKIGTDAEVEVPSIPNIGDLELDSPNKRLLIQSKFPFSLPWDLKSLFNLFDAPADPPRFEIDVVPPNLKNKIGITGNTMFVFDMDDFALVGSMSRFFSFISACLGLILVTRNIIKS